MESFNNEVLESIDSSNDWIIDVNEFKDFVDKWDNLSILSRQLNNLDKSDVNKLRDSIKTIFENWDSDTRFLVNDIYRQLDSMINAWLEENIDFNDWTWEPLSNEKWTVAKEEIPNFDDWTWETWWSIIGWGNSIENDYWNRDYVSEIKNAINNWDKQQAIYSVVKNVHFEDLPNFLNSVNKSELVFDQEFVSIFQKSFWIYHWDKNLSEDVMNWLREMKSKIWDKADSILDTLGKSMDKVWDAIGDKIEWTANALKNWRPEFRNK